MQYVFPQTGAYDVTVVAANGVSSQNASTSVVVQEGISLLSLSSYHPQEGDVILVAHIDGKLTLKQWYFDALESKLNLEWFWPFLYFDKLNWNQIKIILNVGNWIGTELNWNDIQTQNQI